MPHSHGSHASHQADQSATQPHPLLSLLYDSLLHGTCSDITIRIDQWGLEYRLHRLVLIQAGFFHSLFLGGFSEGDITGSSDYQTSSTPNRGAEHITRLDLKQEEGYSATSGKETDIGGVGSGGYSDGKQSGGERAGTGANSVLRLSFDDENITRCAFEICISRLYSSRPSLHVSPTLLPSATYPLTPSFPHPPLLSAIHSSPTPNSTGSSSSQTQPQPTIQPVTSRLLLSLLATSIYLGQNDVVRESLGLILGSVSPWSVGRYLGFAIGRGIGERDVEADEAATLDTKEYAHDAMVIDKAAVPARGMEAVGRRIEPMVTSVGAGSSKTRNDRQTRTNTGRNWIKEEQEEEDIKPTPSMLGKDLQAHLGSEELEETKVCELKEPPQSIFLTPRMGASLASSDTTTPVEGETSFNTSTSGGESLGALGRPYFYGFGGDKIGEACVAWLARWGQDLLEVEEAQFEAMVRGSDVYRHRSGSPYAGLEGFSRLGVAGLNEGLSVSPRPNSTSRDRRSRSISFQLPEMEAKPTLFPVSPASKIRGTSHGSSTNRLTEETFRSSGTTAPPLCVWGYGGLPAAWVRGIIASDEFFIENELERYQFAKRVLELRRLGKEHDGRKRNSDDEIALKEEGEGQDVSMEESAEDEEEEAWEEAELAELFVSGIRFSHMPFEELKALEMDFNPDTNQPYVPIAVLQAASWAALDLRGTISAYKPDGTYPVAVQSSTMTRSLSGSRIASPPTALKAEHGLALTTSDIIQAVEAALRPATPKWSDRPGSPRTYSNRTRDLGNASFSSSGMSSPGGSPRRARNMTANLPQQPSAADRFYWPVPIDSTVRIGDAASQAATFYPFHPYPDLGPGASPKLPGKPENQGHNTSEGNYFGFGNSVRTGREIVELCDDGISPEARPEALWSKYEPFRFSVEFWNVESLGEKERAYSKTVFHAGSYFNIYVQTLKKKDKGVQLGIYLHRQSMLEPLPAASKPSENTSGISRIVSRSVSPTGWNASSPAVHRVTSGTTGDNPLAMHRTNSQPPGTPTPILSISPPVHGGAHDDEAQEDIPSPRSSISRNAPASPYRDPRKTARVFFSVSCASAMGTALTRFSSGPDSFAVSQSWGWRSSSLRSQEYLACGTKESAPSTRERLETGVLGWVSDMDEDWPKKNLHSLRASVVLGVL